jgi:hypothetical protein
MVEQEGICKVAVTEGSVLLSDVCGDACAITTKDHGLIEYRVLRKVNEEKR